MEAKEYSGYPPAGIADLAFTESDWATFESVATTTFGRPKIITPDDVRGSFASLAAAVSHSTPAWPRLDDSRGKVVFILDKEYSGYASRLALDPLAFFFSGASYTGPHKAFVNMGYATPSALDTVDARGFIYRYRADSQYIPLTEPTAVRCKQDILDGWFAALDTNNDDFLTPTEMQEGFTYSYGPVLGSDMISHDLIKATQQLCLQMSIPTAARMLDEAGFPKEPAALFQCVEYVVESALGGATVIPELSSFPTLSEVVWRRNTGVRGGAHMVDTDWAVVRPQDEYSVAFSEPFVCNPKYVGGCVAEYKAIDAVAPRDDDAACPSPAPPPTATVCTTEVRFCPDGRPMDRDPTTCAWRDDECPEEPTADNAEAWRATVWQVIKESRLASDRAAAAKSEGAPDAAELAVAAGRAAQAVEASLAARAEAERLAATKAAENAEVFRAATCELTGGVKRDCVLSEWATISESTSPCGGGFVHQSRGVVTEPMCGGAACGATNRILPGEGSQDGEPSCILESNWFTRVTLFLPGLSPATFDAAEGPIKLAVGAYFTALSDAPVRIQYVSRDRALTPTAKDTRWLLGLTKFNPHTETRRGRRGADTPSTDTELVFDVVTQFDPADPASQRIGKLVAADGGSSLRDYLHAASMPQDEGGAGSALDGFFIEASDCEPESCGSSKCGYVSNGCGGTVRCGNCGLTDKAGKALSACLNDGDCWHVRQLLDSNDTLNPYLADRSQL